MQLLQGPSPKQFEVIKQELGENEGDIDRGVRDLLAMCAASSQLPRPGTFDRKFLELFVRGCRMDTERARAKFEAFCMARVRHRDLYEHRSLSEPPLQDVCNFISYSFIWPVASLKTRVEGWSMSCQRGALPRQWNSGNKDIIPLPKLTDEGYRVTVFRIKPNYKESAADVGAAVRAVLLVCDVRMHDEKPIAGDVFIWDVSAVKGSIVGRVASAFGSVRRGIHLAHAAYPQRLKRNYVVGAPAFLASSLQLMRSCVNEKVKRRFCLHQKLEDLLEYIPARVLPIEFGGQEESLDILARKWRSRIDELRDYLRGLSEMSNNPAQIKNNNGDIYGTVGAFRKLEID